MMQRYALAVHYDGSGYHGWQLQEDVITVQYCLERALSRVANRPITVVCAGRTDTGVHACAQIVHFDADVDRTEHAWVFGTNSNLPSDIKVQWVKPVPESFHARYTAQARMYRYILLNQPVRPAISRKFVGWYYKPLNVTKMHDAAQLLLGEQDFSAFRGASCQAKHPMRTLYCLDIKKQGNFIVFEVKANAFLLHMVRNLVGTLIEVGDGSQPVSWIGEVLHGKDRRSAGPTVMPNGLYLVSVDYPKEFALPINQKGPFFIS